MTAALTDPVLSRAADEVVPVLRQMIGFDTTIREHDDEPRPGDAAHQAFVADYLNELGAEVELFEPSIGEFSTHPMYRPNQKFEGRPILWARLAGGPGPSLLFNGHYDTVVADPISDWTHDPWSADIDDGRVYGRGSCDMKGGIAAALAAAHALVAEGVSLPGDIYFNIVPFEEVNGMGTTATVLRGYRADAAICCEPTELNTLVACRGILLGRLDVRGRSAHAEVEQPHHSLGGGVNAIDKLIDLLLELRKLNDDWRSRPDKQHWLLPTPYVLTTIFQGGAFASNWPADAWALLDLCYLPGEEDETGYGAHVKDQIADHIEHAAAVDPWLRDNPPTIEWLCDFPPKELPADHPLVATVSEVATRQGISSNRVAGFDTWADQVMLMKDGGVPCVCFGPGSLFQAHAVDEFVPVADLESCTRIYADLMVNWGASA